MQWTEHRSLAQCCHWNRLVQRPTLPVRRMPGEEGMETWMGGVEEKLYHISVYIYIHIHTHMDTAGADQAVKQ